MFSNVTAVSDSPQATVLGVTVMAGAFKSKQ